MRKNGVIARRILGCILTLLMLSQSYALTIKYKLIITVVGLRSNQGKVYISLYNSQEGFPTEPNKALRKSSVGIINGKATLTLDDLPEGVYAAACFHDEDNNGKLNTNFIGMPTEGIGASNDAKGFFGPPKYKDAAFSLRRDGVITIRIQY